MTTSLANEWLNGKPLTLVELAKAFEEKSVDAKWRALQRKTIDVWKSPEHGFISVLKAEDGLNSYAAMRKYSKKCFKQGVKLTEIKITPSLEERLISMKLKPKKEVTP